MTDGKEGYEGEDKGGGERKGEGKEGREIRISERERRRKSK